MGIHHHLQRAIHSIQTFTQWVVGKIMLWLLVPLFPLLINRQLVCLHKSRSGQSTNVAKSLAQCGSEINGMHGHKCFRFR